MQEFGMDSHDIVLCRSRLMVLMWLTCINHCPHTTAAHILSILSAMGLRWPQKLGFPRQIFCTGCVPKSGWRGFQCLSHSESLRGEDDPSQNWLMYWWNNHRWWWWSTPKNHQFFFSFENINQLTIFFHAQKLDCFCSILGEIFLNPRKDSRYGME